MTADTERLIDLVHAARDDGLYDTDPAWDEIDALLRLHRPKVPLRGVGLPPDPGGPVGFTCPICGAHEDVWTTSLDAEVVEMYPQVQMWPGGPVVDDTSAPREMKVLDRTLLTSTCAHTFKESEWTFGWCRHSTSGREWMTVTPRPEMAR